MNRLFTLIFFLFFSGISYGFDIIGLQPSAPNGVFSTFSAESLPKGRASVELGAERSNGPDFYRFDLKAAYGVTDSIEFNAMIPYVYNFESTTDGMEDISFGVKHRFYDEGKYGPSLAYLITASLNNGRDEFSTQGRYGIGLIVSKRIGPFSGHLNALYEKPFTESLKHEMTFSGGIELSAAHNFKLLAELIAKKSHFSGHYDRLEARFGYRFRTAENIYTTFGAGVDLKKRSPEVRVILAIGFTTPQKKPEIKRIYESE